ncbi:hypothetical protein COCC4DRAFT_144511 [Bipolaris maydis ATCC 48331]|uniref:Uncharacterized protein n=2 Tax=Cochliobolus heterostrophus TaxID=5016 RepID=M2VCL5_COCH5|nr:uncharacterized protein COCC4DRAFT_144511 [Bipolaris maydis ATCC 48331]EMD97767.1 hypothetical protein COCHEDRAFT_1026119 [Bipolaris maydis C5]ENI02837.1 hypothetical protein COCC4DRAFT_144511 [Bipolaris maydis ATCC 48331]
MNTWQDTRKCISVAPSPTIGQTQQKAQMDLLSERPALHSFSTRLSGVQGMLQLFASTVSAVSQNAVSLVLGTNKTRQLLLLAGGGDEEESVLALSDGHFATREHWARAYANTWDGTLPTTLNYYEHMVNQDNQCSGDVELLWRKYEARSALSQCVGLIRAIPGRENLVNRLG